MTTQYFLAMKTGWVECLSDICLCGYHRSQSTEDLPR